MYFYPQKVKYPTDTQIEIWTMKRGQLTGREIAAKRSVTPGMVSKTLTEANTRVKALLQNAARMNKITLKVISPEHGYARGLSHMFNVKAYITFSPENGVQVWYDHKGDCVKCDKYSYCRESILQEFKERNIEIENRSLRPTDLVEILLSTVEKMLE
ncbi:hypothetical protein CEE45_02810 [Candidatus Heimdallarchaeota archaeon B3_Heim]|nr:MAG: hypothetical protein CEE45_02810 [Candidatus Heimdallarchaeota archaeon B3_Heim]